VTNIVGRDERGRFAIGNRGGGRPKEEWKRELTSALRHRFSGERIADILEDALDLAIKQKSPRGIVAIVECIRDTVDGRPLIQDNGQELTRCRGIPVVVDPWIGNQILISPRVVSEA